jgi:hypothetical protein
LQESGGLHGWQDTKLFQNRDTGGEERLADVVTGEMAAFQE